MLSNARDWGSVPSNRRNWGSIPISKPRDLGSIPVFSKINGFIKLHNTHISLLGCNVLYWYFPACPVPESSARRTTVMS